MNLYEGRIFDKKGNVIITKARAHNRTEARRKLGCETDSDVVCLTANVPLTEREIHNNIWRTAPLPLVARRLKSMNFKPRW